MRMREGERWRCMNADCRCEIGVLRNAEVEGQSNPRCCCGSPMKKPYTKPVLKTFKVPVEGQGWRKNPAFGLR